MKNFIKYAGVATIGVAGYLIGRYKTMYEIQWALLRVLTKEEKESD